MSLKIAIIGAGVIGLTSAQRLLELIPNVSVTVFAEKFSPNTTSDVSAGYWEPYCIDESSDQAKLILKWGKETYDRMLKIANSHEANTYGVQSLSAFVIQDEKHERIPYWSTIVKNFRKLNRDDVDGIIANNEQGKYKTGFEFLSTTVVVNRFLPVLTENLKKRGVKFVEKKIPTLDQFIADQGRNYDYIINCTGLGAKHFVPDENMYAVKGQVLRVRAPWIKHCIMFESDEIIYILPLSDMVVVGGTQEPNNYSLSSESCDKILNNSFKHIPSLKEAEVVNRGAGLRPARKGGVRLEFEQIKKPQFTAKVVHNYGHGGAGITLCWGCASHTVDIILNDLKNSHQSHVKSKL